MTYQDSLNIYMNILQPNFYKHLIQVLMNENVFRKKEARANYTKSTCVE